MTYKKEISWDDPKIIDYFLDEIKKYIDKEVAKLPFVKMYPAIVVSVGDGVADIKLSGAGNVIPDVKVRDGLSLSANDEVYVTLINGSAINMFIDVKK